MDKDYHRKFDQCPTCGSKERFFESLANELKERGLAGDNFVAGFNSPQQGVVIDKKFKVPIGSELPGFGIIIDICTECGTVYAIDNSRQQEERHANAILCA